MTTETDYIKYRVSRARESFEDAEIMAKKERWNACVGHLYYACFYVVSALLYKYHINAKTHTGIKSQFGLHFVKTGKISKEKGDLLTVLMNLRQQEDYTDFIDFDKETVKPLISPVKKFLKDIENLINKK
ncbi:MAG: HEPN domain-containing protein [Bacteroidia bacterium]